MGLHVPSAQHFHSQGNLSDRSATTCLMDSMYVPACVLDIFCACTNMKARSDATSVRYMLVALSTTSTSTHAACCVSMRSSESLRRSIAL